MFKLKTDKRRVLWVGKKTITWANCRARLKKKFAAMGITRCELNYDGNCTPDDFLTWAHGKKRRKLEGDELETCVVLACQNCHQIAERLPAEEMLAVVEKTIADREELLEEMERERVTEECWKEYQDGQRNRSQYR